jgi:hypothetical protein
VHQRGVADLTHEGQGPEPLAVRGVQALARPLGRRARVAVEPAEVQPIGHGVLVIARHDGLGPLGDQLDTRQGIGAVADGIAQAQHGVGLVSGVGEDRAQRLEVGVDVGQNRVSQGGSRLTRRPVDALSGSDPTDR